MLRLPNACFLVEITAKEETTAIKELRVDSVNKKQTLASTT